MKTKVLTTEDLANIVLEVKRALRRNSLFEQDENDEECIEKINQILDIDVEYEPDEGENPCELLAIINAMSEDEKNNVELFYDCEIGKCLKLTTSIKQAKCIVFMENELGEKFSMFDSGDWCFLKSEYLKLTPNQKKEFKYKIENELHYYENEDDYGKLDMIMDEIVKS